MSQQTFLSPLLNKQFQTFIKLLFSLSQEQSAETKRKHVGGLSDASCCSRYRLERYQLGIGSLDAGGNL